MIVQAINRTQRSALLDTGEIVEITAFFDSDGDDCAPDDAISCIARAGDNWLAIDLADFDAVPVQ